MDEQNNRVVENQEPMTNELEVTTEPIETEAEAKAEVQPKKFIPKTAIIGAAVGIVVIVALLIFLFGANERKYKKAFELIDSGDYAEAYELFNELGDYKDTKQYLNGFHYVPTSITKTGYESTENITISLGDNNLPKTILVIYDNEYGKYEEKYEYTYDDKGNVTLIINTDSDGFVSTIAYEYDTNGNLTKGNNNGDIFVYTYDDFGNLILEESDYHSLTYTYDAQNNLIKKAYDYGYVTTYTYDSNNRLIQSIYYMDETKILTSTEYMYDANGNLTKEVETNISAVTYPIGSKLTLSYTYDANGNLIESVESIDDDLGWKAEYEYAFVYIPIDISAESIRELISDFG